MIIITLHFFLFISIIFSNGLIFQKKILKIKNDTNFYEISLIGLVITLFISQILNFLIPLTDILLYVNIFLLIIYFFYNKNTFLKNFKFDLIVFIFCLLVVFINIYGANFSDDIDHYHYGYISNADNINFIWGNSFLHPLYGTSPIWLTFQSYLNLNNSLLQDIHVTNGIIFFLILGLFITELKSKQKLNFFIPIIFSILMFILLKYTRLKEFGIDRPATLLFCLMLYYYLKHFFIYEKINILPNFIVLFFISFSVVLIKITYLPILILPLFIFINYKRHLLKIDIRYILLFLPILALILKNLLGTGCLIFPVEKSCVDFFTWSNASGAKEFSFFTESFNKSWTNYDGNLSNEEYLRDFNWLFTWFERVKFELLEFGLTIILVSVLTFFSFGIQIKKFDFNKINLKLLLYFSLLFIVLTIFIFVYKNPVLRMFHPTLISGMIFLLILFCNFNPKKFKINLIYIFIIFGLLFNFGKNINRINDKNFINDPYLEISSKITKPKEKYLDDFIYYQGWYGANPIGGLELVNKKHKKILLFTILYKKGQ